MNIRAKYLSWTDSDPTKWSYHYKTGVINFLVFELTSLPNFSEPRFHYLGEQIDDRKNAIIQKQLRMLRQLHSIGKNSSISLRIKKDHSRLRLYVVIRLSTQNELSAEKIERIAGQVSQALPSEYNFVQVSQFQHAQRWADALDISWSNYGAEIIKYETTYSAHTWPYFYHSSLWTPNPLNNMEQVCLALLNSHDRAMISIVLTPTRFSMNEREWLNSTIREMKDNLSGARLENELGRILKRFPPMPTLRVPIENYEALLKKYEAEHVFLFSFRVFSESDPTPITQALISSSTRSRSQVIEIKPAEYRFSQYIENAQFLNIMPELHSSWWDSKEKRPFRAQRLHRLASISEISSFWRIPISIQAEFPGFDLDIGHTSTRTVQPSDIHSITLGSFSKTTGNHHRTIADFDREQLTKHGLVVGVPGSGKTTTMFNILYQLWHATDTEHRIPFMVLEPAKTEYRSLMRLGEFQKDMWVFTLGDERISPFRFNPFEVMEGIPLESHIARLNACFVGAFNLFDPLPLLLDKAIRESYAEKGWLDDCVGGELDVVPPTLTDLRNQALKVIENAGYSEKLSNDFKAALIQRLDSLRRGSKGRMLDTRKSIPFGWIMQHPVIFELDALNGDEKSLLMMFLLSFVYEYAKANRLSGSKLRHVLLVEEAHNLIGRSRMGNSEYRANPQEQSIKLFIQMLAEMRALGEGILIADQLPTALAPEAMKQTNLKVLMRMTARDDREEIGNTMDLEEEHLKEVTRFRSGQGYVYLEDWDHVQQVAMVNFKEENHVIVPPTDMELTQMMSYFERKYPHLYMPFLECQYVCEQCDRRTRTLAERTIQSRLDSNAGTHFIGFTNKLEPLCQTVIRKIEIDEHQNRKQYGNIGSKFSACAYVHALNFAPELFEFCKKHEAKCFCRTTEGRKKILTKLQNKKDSVSQSR